MLQKDRRLILKLSIRNVVLMRQKPGTTNLGQESSTPPLPHIFRAEISKKIHEVNLNPIATCFLPHLITFH